MLKHFMLVLLAMLPLVLTFIVIFWRPSSKEPLVGELSRRQIERVFCYSPDIKFFPGPQKEASLALGKVPAGAMLSIYLGTWCSDSVRELQRFWQALDALGQNPPFQVRYIGVDRNKWAPEVPPDLGLSFIPTFVVSRDGRELGRIVESAPRGIEIELKELLSGEQHGVISGRAELGDFNQLCE